MHNNIDNKDPRDDNGDRKCGESQIFEPGARTAPDDKPYHQEEGNQKYQN